MNEHTPPPVDKGTQLRALFKLDEDIPISTRVGQYVKLRDKIAALNEAHKEKMAPLNNALEQLHDIMLAQLNALGTDSSTTKGVGTVYKTIKKSATVADGAAFQRHVIGSEAWDLVDMRANAPAIEKFIEEHGDTPPGVNFKQVARVGVRRG